MPEMTGTLKVALDVSKGVGEMLGGAKAALQGKQGEGPPTKMGMVGGMGMKALTGSEGMGGLKKQMGGMLGPIGKMGSALGKGGVIGMASAGIGAIMGIVTKALGSSSIFTGVAAQFWKIAGVMVDMLLMPLLPYMMKFIQWMMTSVMPEVMKLSAGISKALGGDIGPLLAQLGKLLLQYLMLGYIKIPKLIEDILVVWWKNSVPSWLGGQKGTTLKSLREDREEKKQQFIESREAEGKGGWKTGMIGAMSSLPGLGGIVGSATQSMHLISKKEKEFGDNIVTDAGNAEGEMTQFVDKEKNTGKAWWQKFNFLMYKGSILPNIKKDIQGYLENIGDEAGATSDGLFSWIGSVDWSVFGKIGTMIMDAASGVWGAIKGFFTGKDDDGKEVTPSIGSLLSTLNPLEWFPSLLGIGGDMLTMITEKAGKIWAAITGFFTGKDSDGKEVTPSIISSLPGIPSMSGIITTIVDIKDEIVKRAKAIWHQIKGFFTGEGTTNPGAWTGDYILDVLPDVPDLSGIITALVDVKQMIVDRATAIWTGVKTWFTETIMDKLPKWGTAEKMTESWVRDDLTGEWILEETFQEGTGILGKLSGILKNVMDVGGTIKEFGQKIWDGVFEFFTVTLPGKIPEWSEIVDTVEEVWGKVDEFGGKIGTAVAGFFRGLWGSWSGKTGIAGAIPKLMETLGNLDIMGNIGDLFNVNLKESSESYLKLLQMDAGGLGTIEKTGEEKYFFQHTWSASVGDLLKHMGTKIKDKAMAPIEWIGDQWDKLQTFMNALPSLGDLSFSSIGTTLKKMINGLVNWINDRICGLFGLYNNLPLLPDVDVPQLPTPFELHTGGIVPGGMNQNRLAVLQGGERVTPRGQSPGGGGGTNQTISITINSNFSPGDIIRSITQSGAVDSAAYLNTVG